MLKSIKIKKINIISNEDVYDITTERNHNFFANNLLVHNCGEIPGSPDMTTVCLLGSINIPMYIEIDENNKPYFDWNLYKHDIMIYSRMLDNVCDLTDLPLPSYTWAVKNLRQYGMGLNGIGSALIMLGIKYNSQEAVDFIKELNKIKENLTMQASSLLAKEKGQFSLYDYEKLSNTEYFKSDRLSDETKNMIKLNGLRNAKTTTSPPLGNCVSKDTIIHSNDGNKSLKLLFEENNIEYNKYENQWFVPIVNTHVMTHTNEFKKIIGLFVKGKCNGLKIKTEHDFIIGKSDHKVLVKIDNNNAEWKCLSDLSIGDVILSKK